MTYNFVLAALKHLPNVIDWKLVIRPEDTELLEIVSKKWLESYTARYMGDPHISIKSNISGTILGTFNSIIMNPLLMDRKRTYGISCHFTDGETVYMNRNGGYSSSVGFTVIEVCNKKRLIFPKTGSEVITISKYPGCKHYYLSSIYGGRIFDDNGFDTIQIATQQAIKYTDKKHIVIKY